jgi:hypothetical protein
MKSLKLPILFCLSLLSINNSSAQERINSQVTAALNLTDSMVLKANISYLADDRLLGRAPGTAGYQMAVDYVTAELRKNGVKPAGEDGTWLQSMVFRKALIKPDYTASLQNDTSTLTLTSAKDIFLFPNPTQAQTKVNAKLVFAGYGITDPALDYDDYTNISVKGKIVLVVRGAPQRFPSSDASHSQNITTIERNALAHGAIGVIFWNPAAGTNLNATRTTNNVFDRKGKMLVSSTFYSDKLKIAGFLTKEISTQILSQMGKDALQILANLKNGQPQSFPTNKTLAAAYQSTYKDFTTFNVVGKIEGSDPVLKQEYVVHSAHLDHVGIGPVIEGDSIYNGAHDNASGIASLLQITKIYQGLAVKPKRSILILMVSGEEQGLLGSGYFALKPTLPIRKIVADVNTDMPTIIAPLLSITALGAEHSSLTKQVDEAATFLGLTVEQDPEPAQNRFVRSDQYSFVRQGIPALHIKYGNKTTDGKNDLYLLVEKWRAKYYHKPQDDINGLFNFTAGCTYAKLNFLIGYLVANEVQKPAWNPGDTFGKSR